MKKSIHTNSLVYVLQNLAHYIAEVHAIMDRKWSSLRLQIHALWWRVHLGKRCSARGVVYFKRRQDSCIIIGDECNFLSRPTVNPMGVFCPCMFTTTTKGAVIHVGDRCGFSGVRVWAAKSVTLGNNVRCGANVLITDSDAHAEDSRAGKDAPVVIEDNVWLGMNVMVLKGVHIGKNSLIGAGSIVTRDIPANVMAAGVPCKVIKELKI